MPFMPSAWDKLAQRLPQPVLERLVQGDSGKLHLLQLAADTLAAAKQGDALLTRLGAEFLLAAWESAPLDRALAWQLLAIEASSGVLPAGLTPLLKDIADCDAPKPPYARIQRLLRKEDSEAARETAREILTSHPLHGDVLHLLAGLGPPGPCAWAVPLLQRPWKPHLEPLRLLLLGNLQMLLGDSEQARELFAAAHDALPLQILRIRQGECLKRLGRHEQALTLWLQTLQNQPWRGSLALRARDLAKGLCQASAPLPERAAILLYTCGKDRELAATLDSLLQSELSDSLLVVLQNGVHTATKDCVAGFQKRAGSERLLSVELPVNIGAPAARNWLAHLPQVQDYGFTAYLDDDALVPPDWLGRLGAAVAACPDAGVWGCKVVDAVCPTRLQSVDLHLQQDASREDKALKMSDLQLQEPDFGQFDYMRSCVSVTGCCHLFRTQTLLHSGGFDIRFSPTQFDDLDHDLRLLRSGLTVFYQGHLRVLHLKSTGEAGMTDRVAASNAFANMDKLRGKHSPMAVRSLIETHTQRCLQELSRAHAYLAGLDR